MTDIPSNVPSELVAGDTWSWTRSLCDYPATTWSATVYFENKDGTFNIAGSTSGSDFSFTITAAITAGYKAGRYQWRLRVTDGSATITVESGWVEVLADPAASGRRDVRSWARRTLDALEATLEGRASRDQLAMSINGRSISRMSLSDLTDWRDRLRQEVKTEENASTAGKGRDIKVRYGRS